MIKIVAIVFLSLLVTGCSSDSNYQEQNNLGTENKETETPEETIELEQEVSKEEELTNVEPDSLYLEDSIRGDIDNGTYLNLGESMEFYLKNTNGDKFLYSNIKPIKYITKLEKGNDYDDQQWYQDIHFIFEVTGTDEPINFDEVGEISNNFNELIDAKLFFDDMNLGKYFYGDILEDGSNFKKVARYTNIIKVDGEELYSCYASGASGFDEATGIRTCALSFSYTGPGEYLLAMSDGAGGFKNYLIDVE